MKLKAESGNTFELVLLRYEHPDITEDRWDSNWLVVSGRASTDDRSWSFVEPCVTAFELEELAEWLEALGNGPADLTFAEPNLAFAFAPWPLPTIRIRFAHGSAPPWLTNADERSAGITLDFVTSPDHAKALAADLRNALDEFPPRGGAA